MTKNDKMTASTQPAAQPAAPAKPAEDFCTEMVFILDRSGSMAGKESDTIGGFNSMIERQKKEPGKALVSTVLFDGVAEVLHDRMALGDIAPMTEKDYCVRGCTALLDAVGGAIRHIGNIHKYARKEDVPDKTVFVIFTDGMENASRLYSHAEVRRLIEAQKERFGWEFVFLGANIDAVASAERIGIDRRHTADFVCDSGGIKAAFCSTGKLLQSMACCEPFDEGWADEVRKDFRKRGRK